MSGQLIPDPPNVDLYEAAKTLESVRVAASTLRLEATSGGFENGAVAIARLASAITSLCAVIEPLLRDHPAVRKSFEDVRTLQYRNLPKGSGM